MDDAKMIPETAVLPATHIGDGGHVVSELSAEAVDAEAVKVKSLSISDTTELGCEPPRNNPESGIGKNSEEGDSSAETRVTRNRQYRNHHNYPHEDDASNGSVSGISVQPSRPRSRSSDGKRLAETQEDFPLPKYARQHHTSANDDGNDGGSVENDIEGRQGERIMVSATEDEDLLLGDAQLMSPDERENDADEDWSEADEAEEEMHHYSGSNLGIDSSPSINFADDSTSSSSATYSDTSLPDLEERQEGDESGVRSAFLTADKTDTRSKKAKKATELPNALCKPKPKETWNAPKAILQREIACGPHAGRRQAHAAELFRADFYGSLFSAEKLELMLKLEGHQGCVNCLNFNHSGTKLASGSDDLDIKIWNCTLGKCLTSFHSGHKANVFQAKFMPFVGVDTMIVSCARDNQVRLNELSSSGEVRSSRKLAQHTGPAHKLSMSADNPHVVLSCGEDSYVFSIDTREERPHRLLNVKENGKKVALYSIHQNPFQPQEFCVSGKDSYVRIYDIRKLPSVAMPVDQGTPSSLSLDSGDTRRAGATPVKKFCPHHLVNAGNSSLFTKTNVTAAVYNYNGQEILASYNDEHIYLFDSSHSDGADFIKKYEGHRNSATVKGVNFFGDRSQFVVSGSDDGHVFVWDKKTECIVNFFIGDENGVVNCLEGHPMAPILATSGLDDDIKIWVPSHESPPKMPDLLNTVKRNYKKRENEPREDSASDGFIMWALLNQMRGTRSSRRERQHDSDSDDLETEETDGDDDDEESHGVDCTIS